MDKYTGLVKVVVQTDDKAYVEESNNNITINFPKTLSSLVSNEVSYDVTKFKIGRSLDSNPYDALQDEIIGYEKLITSKDWYRKSAGIYTEFILEVNIDEAVGELIGEFGLTNENGDVVARYVMNSAITKTDKTKITIFWKIFFT